LNLHDDTAVAAVEFQQHGRVAGVFAGLEVGEGFRAVRRSPDVRQVHSESADEVGREQWTPAEQLGEDVVFSCRHTEDTKSDRCVT
jgi:hypothetical protein